MSDPLADFLLARIAEDEAVARGATPGPWRYDPTKYHRWSGTDHAEESVFTGPRGAKAVSIAGTGPVNDPQSMWDAEHIGRWGPARVIAECEAKRRIVERAQAMRYAGVRLDGTQMNGILADLALPYADHPDYRAEWRP